MNDQKLTLVERAREVRVLGWRSETSQEAGDLAIDILRDPKAYGAVEATDILLGRIDGELDRVRKQRERDQIESSARQAMMARVDAGLPATKKRLDLLYSQLKRIEREGGGGRYDRFQERESIGKPKPFADPDSGTVRSASSYKGWPTCTAGCTNRAKYAVPVVRAWANDRGEMKPERGPYKPTLVVDTGIEISGECGTHARDTLIAFTMRALELAADDRYKVRGGAVKPLDDDRWQAIQTALAKAGV